MIKNFSIKKGLFAIAGLQIFLTLAFLLYLISFNTYQSYNTATNRYYQVGEQLLSTAESMIGDLENATFFPAQLYTQNNDSYLCRTLREGPILKNYRFYSYFNTHAQSSLSSDSVSFIALYDLEQNGVVSSRKEGYRTDGLVRHALKDGVEGASYQYTFPEVRKIISEDETRSVFERNDLMDRIDQIETICRSLESKKHKWDQLRPYVVWLAGKDVKTAMLLLPLLQSIN